MIGHTKRPAVNYRLVDLAGLLLLERVKGIEPSLSAWEAVCKSLLTGGFIKCVALLLQYQSYLGQNPTFF